MVARSISPFGFLFLSALAVALLRHLPHSMANHFKSILWVTARRSGDEHRLRNREFLPTTTMFHCQPRGREFVSGPEVFSSRFTMVIAQHLHTGTTRLITCG